MEPSNSADQVLDLESIATDLADVEIALGRLDDGSYWTCEVSGQAIDDEVLRQRPTARRAADATAP